MLWGPKGGGAPSQVLSAEIKALIVAPATPEAPAMHCETVCDPRSSPAFSAMQVRVSFSAASVTFRMPLLMALMHAAVLLDTCAMAMPGRNRAHAITAVTNRFFKGVILTIPSNAALPPGILS